MTKFCNKCGSPIDISKKFCSHCGTLLKKTNEIFDEQKNIYSTHNKVIINVLIFVLVVACMFMVIYFKAGGKNNLNQEAFEVSKVVRLGMNENDINNIQLVSKRSSGECVFICNKINEFDLSDIIPNKNIKIGENEMIFVEGKGLVSINLKFDINNYQQVKKFLLDKYGKSKYEKWMWGKGTYESESDEWNHNNIIRLFHTKNIKDNKAKDEASVVIMEKEYFYRKNKI